MKTNDDQLGNYVHLKVDFDTAVTRTIDTLKTEGFGVLTQIDVKDTFKQKLGIDYLPYKILGACNPQFAHRALTAAPSVGLLLPCNVTVRQLEDGSIEVAIIDPQKMLGVVNDPRLIPFAEEARTRLERVAKVLQGM